MCYYVCTYVSCIIRIAILCLSFISLLFSASDICVLFLSAYVQPVTVYGETFEGESFHGYKKNTPFTGKVSKSS